MIVIVFEGVLGDVFKQNLFMSGPLKLYFRQGVIKGLRKLINQYQIILFIQSMRIDIRKLTEVFARKGVYFDAVYKTLHKSDKKKAELKSSKHFQDYSQIFIDFGIERPEDLIVLASLELSV